MTLKHINRAAALAAFFLPVITTAQEFPSVDSVTVLYDSTRHQLLHVEQNFPVRKYDVSLTSKIEAEINKRLVFPGKARSVEEVETWAREQSKSDPQLRQLFDNLQSSFQYLSPVAEYGITKVPAVITTINGEQFVVYGETSIQAAVQAAIIYHGSSVR